MGKKKFLIGGVIILLAISYLGYIGFKGSATYYYTISELMEQSGSIQGNNVRITGQVASDSVERELGGLKLRFTISDGRNSLPVVYNGAVPDTFKADSDVVVEGRLNSEGVFQAETIVTKCPSKYAPKK